MDRVLEPYYQYITNAQFKQSIVLQEEGIVYINTTSYLWLTAPRMAELDCYFIST